MHLEWMAGDPEQPAPRETRNRLRLTLSQPAAKAQVPTPSRSEEMNHE
jgi:hypothetical protein